jgi:hypothetical protein
LQKFTPPDETKGLPPTVSNLGGKAPYIHLDLKPPPPYSLQAPPSPQFDKDLPPPYPGSTGQLSGKTKLSPPNLNKNLPALPVNGYPREKTSPKLSATPLPPPPLSPLQMENAQKQAIYNAKADTHMSKAERHESKADVHRAKGKNLFTGVFHKAMGYVQGKKATKERGKETKERKTAQFYRDYDKRKQELGLPLN